MHVGVHFAVSWKTLRSLTAKDWAQEFIPHGSPWDRLFELSYMPTYREILVEFLSLFEFHPRRPEQVVDPAHPPPCAARGFFPHGRPGAFYVACRVCADKPTLLGFWAVIAESRYWDHVNSKGRVTRIRDPLFRYVSYYYLNNSYYYLIIYLID
ncbi:hypothetical protein Hanom_Chr09g00813881 [Helianthus anomalus]